MDMVAWAIGDKNTASGPTSDPPAHKFDAGSTVDFECGAQINVAHV